MKTKRIDQLVVDKGLAKSRALAKNAILNHQIKDNDGVFFSKPSQQVDVSTQLFFVGNSFAYVSRGALKLLKAIEEFDVSFEDKIVADIGASTGGFTQVALNFGAKLVYSIDVGHDQLDQQLIDDKRVIEKSGVNFRYMDKEEFSFGLPQMIVIDVSFISLSIILEHLEKLIPFQTEVVVLIKPQFEAGKAAVKKNGIVKEKKVHLQVLQQVIEFANENSFEVINLTQSPIKGGNGNIEFIAHLKKDKKNNQKIFSLGKIVEDAHKIK